jgi:hypothetical protein
LNASSVSTAAACAHRLGNVTPPRRWTFQKVALDSRARAWRRSWHRVLCRAVNNKVAGCGKR